MKGYPAILGCAPLMAERMLDFPAFGKPASPTSAISFSSSVKFLSSPGSPFSANFGARLEEVAKWEFPRPPFPPCAAMNMQISQTGCIGMCRLEPMVDVILPGKEKVTYVHVKPEMVPRIVAEHIVNGRPVEEYTIGAAEKN